MAKKLGRDLRLFVKSGATFAQPAGQGDLTINRNADTVNTSTKDNFPYGTNAPGLKSVSLTQAFTPDLPDAPYAAMKALDAAGDTTTYQVREKPWGDTDVVFECVMYTSFGNTGAAQGSAVETTATLNAAEAPTVDEI